MTPKWHRFVVISFAVIGSIILTSSVWAAMSDYPTPSSAWLTYQNGAGAETESVLYYASIGAEATLTDWQTTYGFPLSQTQAIYYSNDLGFARNMRCREDGDLFACYVTYYGGDEATALNDATNGTNLLFATAIVYSGTAPSNQNPLKFYAYDSDGNLATNVPFDSNGASYVPHSCTSCHGGRYRNSPERVENSELIPFNVEHMGFSTTPGFTQADQEEAFRIYNSFIISTGIKSVAQDLLEGSYPAGVHNTGSTFDSSYIPATWNTGTPTSTIYTDIVSPYCLACHMQVASYVVNNPSDFSSHDWAVMGDFVMPHSENLFKSFWDDPASIWLIKEMGWDYKVTRTDDPVPDGCQLNDCSLREAILAMNASGYGKAVTFSNTVGTYNVTQHLTYTNGTHPLLLLGNGETNTIIDKADDPDPFNFDPPTTHILRALSICGSSPWAVGSLSELNAAIDCYNAEITGTHTISLTTDFFVASSTPISNSTSAILHVAGNGYTLDGANLGRHLLVQDGNVQVQNVTFLNGRENNGGAVYVGATAVLTINHSSFLSNTANAQGGAIYNVGADSVTIEQTLFAYNQASLDGGAIFNADQPLFIENSTFSQNFAFQQGGAIYNAGPASTLQHVTVVSNTATISGAGLFNEGASRLALSQTIVAYSVGTDCGGTIIDVGENIASDSSCGFTEPTSLNSTDPLLAPLADNGGNTETHALQTGSPAIDSANNGATTHDQRGVARPQLGTNDIGAYEYVPDCAGVIETFATDTASLNEGIYCYNQLVGGSYIIQLMDNITLTAPTLPISNTTGADLTIVGNGRTLDGDFTYRPLTVQAGEVTINQLTTQYGTDSTVGGGLYVGSQAIVRVSEGIMAYHGAPEGGAIYNDGSLLLQSVIISGSNALNGGGIYNTNVLTLTSSTVLSNTATRVGSGTGDGGGVYNSGVTAVTANTQIQQNQAGDDGGGLYNRGYVSIINSLVLGNQADGQGAGLYESSSSGGLYIFDSAVVDNVAGDIGGGLVTDSEATLDQVTITGNQSLNGGGIFNQNILTITNSSIMSNTVITDASDLLGNGGGIFNDGVLLLLGNNTIADNIADDGGGIYNFFVTIIEDTTIAFNQARNSGGGIFDELSADTLEIYNSQILSNTANTDGGGIYVNSLATLISVTLTHNNADAGGAIFNVDDLLIEQATFYSNTANFAAGVLSYNALTTILSSTLEANVVDVAGFGSGIIVDGGTTVVRNTDFLGNINDAGFIVFTGTAFIYDSFFTNHTSFGAIVNVEGELFIEQTDIINNASEIPGGGLFNAGFTVLDNSLLQGNTSLDVGGGLFNAGSFTINQSVITNNLSIDGGGLFNAGEMTIDGSDISYNESDDDGGGITAVGPITVTNSLISYNIAADDGGGLDSDGGAPTLVMSSTLSYNIASGDGGGLDPDDSLILMNSQLIGNQASSGGGIYSDAPITITNSLIDNNSASNFGGGIATASETVLISNSTISNNRADESGGIDVFSTVVTIIESQIMTNTATGSSGGGIYNTNGTVNIVDSWLAGNDSRTTNGGGIYNNIGATLTISGSTLAGNEAFISGGGLYNLGTSTIQNSTISGNETRFSGGAGLFNDGTLNVSYSSIVSNTSQFDGGGYERGGTSGTFSHSIIAYNAPVDCDGAIINSGNNLDSDGSCGSFDTADPLLDVLQDNGGPVAGSTLANPQTVWTHQPQNGSPTIDIFASCISTDQRGIARPQGVLCDIGAVEYVGTASPITPTLSLTYTVTPTATLNWTDETVNCTYDLFASSSPYTGFTSLSGYVKNSSYEDTAGTVGNLGLNTVYYVLAYPCGSAETAVSNTVSTFTFAIVPGTP